MSKTPVKMCREGRERERESERERRLRKENWSRLRHPEKLNRPKIFFEIICVSGTVSPTDAPWNKRTNRSLLLSEHFHKSHRMLTSSGHYITVQTIWKIVSEDEVIEGTHR